MKQIGPLLLQPDDEILLVLEQPVQAAIETILFGETGRCDTFNS